MRRQPLLSGMSLHVDSQPCGERKQQSFADHPKRPFSSPHSLEVVSLLLSITRQKRDDLLVALEVSAVPQGPSLSTTVSARPERRAKRRSERRAQVAPVSV